MSNNPHFVDIMLASGIAPIWPNVDNYDYSGTHMGDRKVVVTLQIGMPESGELPAFSIGDYIIYNGEKFTLQTAPITGRVYSSHMLSYTLTFWWNGYELQLANFLDVMPVGDDSGVYYNATSDVVLNDTISIVCGRIIANLDRSGYGGWTFDIHTSVDLTVKKDIEALNLQCYDVLQLMATAFGVEYQFDNATKTIWVGWPVNDEFRPRVSSLFEYGKDKGICEINRVQNDQKVITRVRGFGSTRNINSDYRRIEETKQFNSRLILPEDTVIDERYSIINGYLVDTINEAAYGIREGVPYINEDIYPTIEGLDNTVKAVGLITDRPVASTPQYNTVIVSPEWTEWVLKYAYQGEIWQEAHPDAVPEYIEVVHPAVVREELVETVPQGTYDTATFFVADLGIDLNDESIYTGAKPKIAFTTGNHVGIEFEIASFTKYMTTIAGVPTWDDGFGNQYWRVTVVRNSEDPNHIVPSELIPIQVGDKYVFLDIYLPDVYEAAAEARLLTATLEYLKANTKSPEGYAIKLSEEYFTKFPLTLGKFKEGNAVLIKDTVLGLAERAVLIQSMSVSYRDNALLPTYNLTISDVPIKGALDVLRSGLKQSSQTITSRINSVESSTNSALKSATILTSRILDNNLDIRGSIIAAQSIEPISQSVELKSAHYILQALFKVDYEGVINAANGSAGALVHKEADVVWDNTYDLAHQTWTIAAPQDFSLLDGVMYYVYVKGSLIDGTATWVVSETKIAATSEQDYYYFEWGQVLAPIEGERIVQTSYGSTYVTHNPVTVNPASAAFASIDANTQVLTVNEQAGGASHNAVTIAAESAGRASIDENQVLTINEQIPTGFLPLQAIEDTKGLTGFANPSDIDVSYNWTNRTITLTGVLDYYWRGVKKTLVSPWVSSAHANTVGKWFLYSTDGINFIWSNDIWDFSYVMVSAVNYKATEAASFAICETHGTMDYLSHEEDHQVNGTYLLSGGKATAGTYIYDTATDAANSPGFDAARVKDEDLETDIPAWIEGAYTKMYIGASSTSVFNIAATLPFVSTGSYMQINNPLTGVMVNGVNLKFYNVYQVLIPATSDSPSQKYRTIFLQPQKAFSSLAEAELEDANGLYFGELQALTAEFKIYSRLTYKTLAGDLNTGKCRLMGISYITGTKGNPINIGGFVPTDHANLSNVIWTDSAHSGTANKLAGFGASGEAVEVDATPAQVNADWNATSGVAEILNKPTIPDTSQFQVHIRFEIIGAKEFECPYACKFTAMIYQQTNAPTLSTALDVNLAQYDILTVTADAIGMVTLTGIWL